MAYGGSTSTTDGRITLHSRLLRARSSSRRLFAVVCIFYCTCLLSKGTPVVLQGSSAVISGLRGRQPACVVRHYKASSRLPLLSTGPAATFPASERHRLLAGIALFCLINRDTCMNDSTRVVA